MCIFKKRKAKKSFQNKAQTSFFLILGVFIFIAAIIGFVVYSNIKAKKAEEEAKKIADFSLQAQEVKKFVDDCIRKASFEGLRKLGETGGYFSIPKLIEFKGTSFWQFDQANIQPFLNQTQERLIEYVDKNVPKCFENANVTQYGFLIEKKEPKTLMEFGASDVTIKVIYPIKVSRGQFTKEFSEFFNTFNIRYRAIYEAATEVNERLFDADFDIKNPLKKLDYLKSMDFDISYKMLQEDIITFTITDKKSITPENRNYAFNFVAKLGNSTLKKLTTLQNRSATNPVVLPYTIYSVDKKAQLDILQGTTINKDGKDVESISVQQSYPSNATTKDVPVHKRNDEVVEKKDLTYVITDPVYSFEPDGLLFNKQQKLTLYYQGDEQTEKGVGILMGKKNPQTKDPFWIPIPSHHEEENKRVVANILGFTEFTAVRCAAQQLKETTGEHFFEPQTTCYVTLVILIAAIVLIIVTFGAGLIASAGLLGSNIAAGVSTLSTWSAGTFALGLGSTATAFTTVAVGITVAAVAGTAINVGTDAFYSFSPDNCETFYPLCDQDITIEKGGDAEEGQCIPETGQRVAAGTASMVCAQVESCGNFLEKIACKSCSVKCTAKFY